MSKRTRTFSLETTGGLSVVRVFRASVCSLAPLSRGSMNRRLRRARAADVNLVSYVQWPGKPSQLLLISSALLGRTDCAV